MPRRIHALLLAGLLAPLVRADEGMWTFEHLPLEQMQTRYGFAPDKSWLDHLRLSTVVFGEDGTGSFVSRDGLVLTNQHIAHEYLQRLSSDGHDLVKEGFLARTREQELRIPGLELKVLVQTHDVTADLSRAVKPGMTASQAEAARSKALEELQRQEAARTGLSCEVASLYQGGEYWLYAYRTFTDVRLVMAPEYDIAAFGKEWDNFAYPRHDLDFSFFRVYENGQPCHPAEHLVWSRKGIANGEMTFVAGHPGRTDRLESVAQMDFRRRVLNPLVVRTLERNLRTLTAYAQRSAASAQEVSSDLLETSNFLKVYREELRGLEDPVAMARVREREQNLRNLIRTNPAAMALAGKSWSALEAAIRQEEPLAAESQLLHRLYCSLERGPLSRALGLVRIIGEAPKPISTRLPGYSDEEIRELEKGLLEAGAVQRDLESLLLRDGLEEARTWLGSGHPLVKAVLGTADPSTLARQAIQGTRIDDPAFLQELLAGGRNALERCQDPLILMAKNLDPISRAVKGNQDALDARIDEQAARIAQARSLVEGRNGYPDATFTLRLSYGAVRPFEAEGTLQQPFTTFGGLYDRADAWGAEAEQRSWALPSLWVQRRSRLDPSTPLNFITTNDIIGGNSGSPVVDRSGELVGLVFDGNIHSISGRYYYDERLNRCIAVDVRAILEVLDKIYEADSLARELSSPW